MPENVNTREAVIINPMLATGGSISSTIARLESDGVKKIKILCIVASPDGIKYIEE